MNNDNVVELNKIISIFFQYFDFVDEYTKKIKDKKIENKIHFKEKNQKFTDLDYLTQKLIENVFKKYFPYIKIIGEEDTSIDIDIDLKNNELLNKEKDFNINKNYFNEFNDFDIKISKNDNITLFLDPIDATNQLIKNNFVPVTMLLVICINEKPFLGFIHYVTEEENKHKNITYFNYPKKGIFSYLNNKIEKISIKNHNLNEWNFIISSSRAKPKMIEFINKFPNSNYIQDNGLGNKAIKVILNDLIYFSTGKNTVGLWDICSSDAIAHEIGGGIFNLEGNEIKYEAKKEYVHEEIFLVNNKERINLFLENVKKYRNLIDN